MLLELGPGDEFIVPAYTFVSTANAFAIRGARPVFADVDENGNLDPAEVDRLRTPARRPWSRSTMQATPATWRSSPPLAARSRSSRTRPRPWMASSTARPLGTFGACGAFSFHETKNVGCGEGGALTIRDGRLLERAEYIRDKGTNRRRFLSGLVDKYTWVDVGSSYVLSDLNAAYLSAQLDQLGRIQERRSSMHRRYTQELAARVERRGAYTIQAGPRNTPNHHLLGIVFQSGDERDRFIAHMRASGILAPFHYVALHESPLGRRYHDGRKLPWSERLSGCLVRLPLYFNMTDTEQEEVIARTLEFLDGP